MTNEEKYKNSETRDLAQLLLDFYIGFNNESIEGLCDKRPCSECDDSCIGCIAEWLKEESK